jgi:hypothetical protein
MNAANVPVKNLKLGISGTLNAAKEFSDEENIQSFTTPKKGAALTAPADTQPAEAATTEPAASNVTPLTRATPSAPKAAKGPRPVPTKRFSVDLPLYVFDQLHNKVHATRMEKKEIILEALRDGGFSIKDVDIYRKGKPND